MRAIVKAQRTLLRRSVPRAEDREGKLPPDSAELIVRTIQRDVEFYDPVITEEAVAKMNAFAQAIGYLPAPVPYDQVVDVRFRQCWTQP